MEFVDKYLKPKCFSSTDRVFLAIFVVFFALLLVVGIPVALATSRFHCPNREISKTKETNLIDDVKTKCLKKYKTKFPVDTILVLLTFSNFFVLVFSIIYAYLVKDRVETFDRAEARSDENERMVLSVEPNPRDYRKCLGHFSTFFIYIIYLFARILLLVAFVIFFYTSDIPDQFPCPYYLDTGSNVTVSTRYKLLIISCDIPGGNKYLFHTVAVLDDVAVILTLLQLGKIIWTGYSDEDFKTDEEFCVVHLLGKRKRAKKMVDKVRGRLSSGYEKKFRRTFEGIHVPFQFFFYHNDGKMSNKERSLSELFKPETSDENQEYPRTICVEGQSGVGKTTLTRELLYKWEKKTSEFLNGKILILLPCYEFKDEPLTLREMLAHGPELSVYDLGIVYQTISSIPKKTVLVFDGLDDIIIDSELLGENSSTVNRPNEKLPFFLIFKRLLDGDWLPGATVLTTLRPTAPHVFQELRFDRKVKILGFSKAQINEYVSKFCKDKRVSKRVCGQINQSTELLSFCYIPAYCYIACLTLDKSNENSRISDTPKTLTELCTSAVKVLKRHHTSYKSNPSPHFCDVSPRDSENLLKLEVIEEPATNERFREYFAATNVVHDLNIDKFLVTHKDPKYHLWMQFVAGLLGDKIKNAKKAGITSDSTCNILGQVKERLQEWILPLKAQTTPEKKNIALVAIKFLYELQDSDTRNSVCSNFLAQEEELSLNDLNITPADSPALFHFIGSIKNLKRLSFIRCTTIHGGNMYTGMAKSLFMNPTNSITSFSWNKNFPDVELKNLSEAVTNEHCKLTELNLPENGIKCIGAKKLSKALKSPRCNIKVLDLAGNEIACDEACNNRQRIKACNSIQDISEALIDSNCKITSLNLAANGINDVGVGHLVEALKDENCKITSLSLAENAITNDGVQHLRGALKSRNFKLTSLNLCGCEDIDERVMLDLKNALLGKKCKLHV